MSLQSIEQQINQLKSLMAFSAQFKSELQSKISVYDNKVRGLYDSGIPVEFRNSFEMSCHQPTKKALSSMIDAIEQRDIPFLKQQIQSLEMALQIAKKNKF